MPFIKVQSIARLTRDPELRVTTSGKSICIFGIAVNTKFADREKVCFIDVEAWEKRAEAINKFFKKGDPIYIEGRLEQDTWEDKTSGQKRSKHKIVLDGFEFFASKGDSAAGERSAAPERHTPPPRSSSPPRPAQDINDEDVPF